MPVFVEDPTQFSKERLKAELIAHSVELPPPDSKKQVYIEFYLKHVKTNNADFSSDEEEDQIDGTAEKEEAGEMVEPGFLTDDQLKAKLLQYGVKAGPIVATTRVLYEKKLKRLLEGSAQTTQHKVNGTGDAGLYSDCEEEDGMEEDEEKDSESALPLSESNSLAETTKPESRGKSASLNQYGSPSQSSLFSSFSISQMIENRFSPQSHRSEIGSGSGLMTEQSRDVMMVEKETMTGRSLCLTSPPLRHEQAHREPVSDVLSEMFPNAEKTPTGIFATKRRSIKGAAGRPVQFKYPEMLPLSPTTLERQEIQQRRVPLWVQLVVFLLVLSLLYLIYCSMDEPLSSPVSALLGGLEEAAHICSSYATDIIS
ncbi:hypothetical protein DNTS_027448 [Danionella cerebrum]|uniref:LEM domain-containing protein n=2 Tax=Danionella cerebrum TaxID=2873325 RepID=A0A553Q4B7_9TELE|nr:hypothetical protein DNTS_027448 [Danionella translucida]